jgi:energy-coupling factor transport system permease protein
MRSLAPLTKLILTAAVSIWALLLTSLIGLSILVVAQVAILACSGLLARTYKAVISLLVFAALMVALQYVLGTDLTLAIAGGLRMVGMTVIFVILLATTKMQGLTTALVSQCRVPEEYAFMFTAALRFVPDFLAESKAVREAQACRGYTGRGSIVRRLASYVAIVGPLVLRAVSRSETMALSIELRGFGSSGRRSFVTDVALGGRDYFMLVGMVALTVGMATGRILYGW